MNSPRSLAVSAALSLVTAFLLVPGAGAGCSRQKPKSGPTARGTHPASSATPEASAVALCSALHELPSRRRAECCGASPLALYRDECVRLLSSAVRAGRVSIDGPALSVCAARVDETTRGCDWVAPSIAPAPAVCAAAVKGLVAQGGRCMSSLECGGNLHCVGQGAASPGTCRPPQPHGAGCGTSVDSLSTYLSLRGIEQEKPQCEGFCSLVAHRCEPTPSAGTPCRASVNCASDQLCRNGRCTPRRTHDDSRASAGESCATDLDFASGGCVRADGDAGTCGKKCSLDRKASAPAPGRNPTQGRTLTLPGRKSP